MEKLLSYLTPLGVFYDQFKSYFILAAGLLSMAAVWHAHTILDEAKEAREQTALLTERIAEEKQANQLAAEQAKKEAEYDKQILQSNADIESHIRANAGFSCPVPSVGVRDLQQAITQAIRTRQSH